MSGTVAQRDRVLRGFINAGPRGVTGYDWSGPRVLDGGDRIMRFAARLYELKADGYRFRKADFRRDGHDVFVLTGTVELASSKAATPSGHACPASAAPAVPSPLFVLPHQPLGAYDEVAA